MARITGSARTLTTIWAKPLSRRPVGFHAILVVSIDHIFLDNTERPSVDDRAACVAIRVHGASLRRSDRGRESRRVELDPPVRGAR